MPATPTLHQGGKQCILVLIVPEGVWQQAWPIMSTEHSRNGAQLRIMSCVLTETFISNGVAAKVLKKT